MTVLLELDELSSGYGDVSVIKGLSLKVSSGSITALVGSNGAGKTTLMQTISGYYPFQKAVYYLTVRTLVKPRHTVG